MGRGQAWYREREHDTLAHLSARLDAQEEELVALRALLAGMQPEEASIPPVTAQSVPSTAAGARVSVPRRTPLASRRTLLKGAGAALFTTALLATGEVIPVAPFRVAAAPPATPTGAPALATLPDTLYQTFIGSDFLPETTTNGATDALHPGGTTFGAGPSIRPRGLPTSRRGWPCHRGRRSPRSSSTCPPPFLFP